MPDGKAVPLPDTGPPPAAVAPLQAIPSLPLSSVESHPISVARPLSVFKPHVSETSGWPAPIVLLDRDGNLLTDGDNYLPGREVGLAVTNGGLDPAEHFNWELLVNGILVSGWHRHGLEPGEIVVEKIGLDEMVRDLSLKPGKHKFELRVNGEASVYLAEFTIATNLPDLKPGMLNGWQTPVVLLDSKAGLLSTGTPFAPGRQVGLAITNSGTKAAGEVAYWLLIDNGLVFTASVPQLLPGQTVSAILGLDELVNLYRLEPGPHRFTVVVDPKITVEELDESNNVFSAEFDIAVARPPVRSAPASSPAGLRIQQMFEGYRWITDDNLPELLAVAREVFKDLPIDWYGMSVKVLPFNEFNKLYGEAGRTPGEKAALVRAAENNSLYGFGFAFVNRTSRQPGNTPGVQSSITLREGILVQVLPLLLRELGGTYSYQRNFETASRMRGSLSREFDLDLLQAYGTSILVEKFGWGGLTDVSYLTDLSWVSSSLKASDPVENLSAGLTIRTLWAAAIEAGYPEGRVPSSVWLKLYEGLVRAADPATHINSLVRKAQALDRDAIARTIGARVVNRPPAVIRGAIRQKIDPQGRHGDYLTLDDVIIHNLSPFVLP
ncbi:MAG: hypothetical protein HY673_04625 [Chloroflexi bacterium]|nr:hypothetical protein [Chloroflexota bacterium]